MTDKEPHIDHGKRQPWNGNRQMNEAFVIDKIALRTAPSRKRTTVKLFSGGTVDLLFQGPTTEVNTSFESD